MESEQHDHRTVAALSDGLKRMPLPPDDVVISQVARGVLARHRFPRRRYALIATAIVLVGLGAALTWAAGERHNDQVVAIDRSRVEPDPVSAADPFSSEHCAVAERLLTGPGESTPLQAVLEARDIDPQWNLVKTGATPTVVVYEASVSSTPVAKFKVVRVPSAGWLVATVWLCPTPK